MGVGLITLAEFSPVGPVGDILKVRNSDRKMAMSKANKASDEVLLPLVISAMESVQNRFLNLSVQAFAFLLIGIGWVVSTTGDQHAWCDDQQMFTVILIAGLFYGVFLLLLFRLKMKQERLAKAITVSTKTEEILQAHYRIDWLQVALAAVVIGALVMIFIVLVWRC